jgi:DNA-binding transcriptional regulator YiaG
MQNVHDSIAVGAMQRGERNGHAKLTQNDVIEIRSSKVTANEFAKRLGVSARHIGRIRRRERWKHVD